MDRIEQMLRRQRNREIGFTLIELMIVVAVIAVLVAIAYPNYINQVRKGKRGQAKADMVTVSHQMERCFTQQNTYSKCWNNNTSDTIDAPLNASSTNNQVNYTITSTVGATGLTYQLVAAPQGDQVNDPCVDLMLDQTGLKTWSGSQSVPNCW